LRSPNHAHRDQRGRRRGAETERLCETAGLGRRDARAPITSRASSAASGGPDDRDVEPEAAWQPAGASSALSSSLGVGVDPSSSAGAGTGERLGAIVVSGWAASASPTAEHASPGGLETPPNWMKP
jgi:hypothetical protein